MTPLLSAETVLITLYCLIDDALKGVPQARPTRPGPAWRLSDSEVLTLGVIAQFVPHLGERAFLRFVAQRFPGAFPNLPDQSGYNRHLHDLWGIWAWLGPALARRASALHALAQPVLYQTMDATGVSLLSKRRGQTGRTYGDGAAIGKGGVDREFFYGVKFYGVKLAALVSDQSLIHGFISGPANTEERFLLEGLLRFRHAPEAEPPTADELLSVLGKAHRHGGARKGPSGPLGPRYGAGRATCRELILADDGYAGQAWQAHWRAACGAEVVVKHEANVQGVGDWFSQKRQVVESAFSRLHAWFGLARPRTKSVQGWWIRLSAKVAAHNALIIINALVDRPLGAKLDVIALP